MTEKLHNVVILVTGCKLNLTIPYFELFLSALSIIS